MNRVVRCAHCKETVEGEAVARRGKLFCSEACAFDATERNGLTLCGHDNNAVAAAVIRSGRKRAAQPK